jgi:UDP-GlcNAc:undecaprenyl-phosphate/decaprenyl-phosphate GlcNAc-1-phosphate transferase
MELTAIKISFSFIFSFLITFSLVPHLCTLARRLRFLDEPDGNIKQHKEATPYLGGVAVYIGFLCGLIFTLPFENKIFFLIIGTTLLLLLGLLDDFVQMSPGQKFFGQIIVALCFLKAGFYLKSHVFHNIWMMPLSVLWILTVINAFNLVDVMDGLATSLAIYASATLFIIAFYLQHSIVMLVLASFLGPLCAFLLYNRPPARIYLGDAGSLFIGGFLATVPFLFDWGTHTAFGYLTPLIILAIPLLECISLILIRAYKKIPFYRGSRDHFSCYLLDNGWGKKQILGYVFFLSTILGITSINFALGKLDLIITLTLGVCFLGVWITGLQCKNRIFPIE